MPSSLSFRWLAWVASLVAALIAATPAAAQDTPLKEIEVAAGAFVRGAPLPDWADLAPVPPAVPTRKPVVVRLADSHLWVGDRPVYLVNRAEQVLDAAALGQIGQAAMHFNPQFQRLLLHKVQVLRDDRTIDHTATAQVRFLQREAGLEQGVYSGLITAAMVLPDVRVGDTLLMQYSIEGDNPIFAGRYAQSASWEQTMPVQWRRVTLVHPASRRIAWKWVGDGRPSSIVPSVTEQNGLKRLRFEERDVPAIDLEPYMPASLVPLRLLQFSEYADWADVARWAATLFPADAPLPTELEGVMARLRGVREPAERVSQALQWVQSEIRYYSIALGESSHRPQLPAAVVRQRYGDCKDKTLLLVRMLQSLGIEAQPVLASLRSPQMPDKLLPSPDAFDHAIVRVVLDGREHFLDPTRLGQTGALETMGQGLEGARVLVADAARTRSLATIASPNRPEIFASELVERFRLDRFDADGELEAEQRWTGFSAEAVRQGLSRLDAAQLQRNLLAGRERRYPGITMVGTPQLQDDTRRNSVTLTARFKVPKLATESAGDWVLRFFPSNLQGSFALPENTTRAFPVVLPAWPATVRYTAEVRWPDSVSVIADPSTQRLGSPRFDLSVSRSFRGNLSRVTVEFEPRVAEVAAKDVPAMVEDVRSLDRLVGGFVAVSRSQIKDAGSAGTGRQTLQDTMQARLKAQVERTGKAIAGGQLTGDDLATALCDRAESLADMGRAGDALSDAQQAVKVAPALGRAFECRANVEFALGEFGKASADYGKALTLGESAFSTYYRRGHARFYDGKLELAAEDFAKAAADRDSEADKLYAMLWQAWTLQRLGRALPAELLALAEKNPTGEWPRPALALFAGKLSPEQVLEQLDRKQGDDRELGLAEGWFYLGQHFIVKGRTDEARDAFRKARSKGITMYIEHVAAGFELQRLTGKP